MNSYFPLRHTQRRLNVAEWRSRPTSKQHCHLPSSAADRVVLISVETGWAHNETFRQKTPVVCIARSYRLCSLYVYIYIFSHHIMVYSRVHFVNRCAEEILIQTASHAAWNVIEWALWIGHWILFLSHAMWCNFGQSRQHVLVPKCRSIFSCCSRKRRKRQ